MTAADLVAHRQLARAMPGREWRVVDTTSAQVHAFPCQQQRYADSRTQAALVRTFAAGSAKGRPDLSATQVVELSATDRHARRAFGTAVGWLAACAQPRTQLVGVRRVSGVGEQSRQFVLRSWDGSESSMVIGVARTGRATTVAMTAAAGRGVPADPAANLRVLTAAVDDLCQVDGGGACAIRPRSRPTTVPRAGELPVMLSEFDLPMVAGVPRAWAGTSPRKALQNLASTGCDRSRFQGAVGGARWARAATRTFVLPRARLSDAFGLTETIGSLPAAEATSFVASVRTKLATCADRDPGTKVLRVVALPDLRVWRVRTEISSKRSVTFWMGLTRQGGSVAQVGFVPDGPHTISSADFVALVHRAHDRLSAMR